MKFTIVPKPVPNADKAPHDDFEKTQKLAKALKEELGDFLRTVVLFGSTARARSTKAKPGDIDVLLVVNDVSIVLSREFVEAYRIIVSNHAKKVSVRFHITTLKLTALWDSVRAGDPIVTNMLRDGVSIYDTGVFIPLQHLLLQGKIRPTREAVWAYYTRAPLALSSSQKKVLAAAYDLYWACMDAAHAALMTFGHTPVTPEHVPEMLEQFLVKKGHLEHGFVEEIAFFYSLSRKITHREIQELTGEEYARYSERAASFVERMRKLVQSHRPPL